MPRVGMLGRGRVWSLQSRLPGEMHRADRSCAACCGCKSSPPRVSADFSSRALSPAPLLQSSKIPHPPGAALLCPSLRGVCTQAGALHFLAVDKAGQPPCRWQSAPHSPPWHLGQRHRTDTPPGPGPASTRIQHVGHFRPGPGSGLGSEARFPHHAAAAVHVFSSAGKTPPFCQAS